MDSDRKARLAEIRQQIDAGEYETPQRLSAAVEALWQRKFAAQDDAVASSRDKAAENARRRVR